MYGGRYAETMGLVDRPDGIRKFHARATPLLGGFAVMIQTLAIAVFFWLTTTRSRFFLQHFLVPHFYSYWEFSTIAFNYAL